MFKKFFQLSQNNQTEKNILTAFYLFLFASGASLIYSLIFFVYDYLALSTILFLSFVIFFLTVLATARKKLVLAFLLAFVSVSITSTCSILFAGIECGAQNYLLSAAVLFLLTDFVKRPVRYLFSSLSFAEYFVINAFFWEAEPLYSFPGYLLLVLYLINTVASFGAVFFSSYFHRSAVKTYVEELTTTNEQTSYLANYDQLTKLGNRHLTYQQLDELIRYSNEVNQPFVIAMVDIDNFKFINDQYGHLCGDDYLKEIGYTMNKALRKNDIVGRWGGEEFLIILPDTEFQYGIKILERIRQDVSTEIMHCAGKEIYATITIGAVEFRKEMSLSDLVQLADERLYLGKQRGKNQVIGDNLSG